MSKTTRTSEAKQDSASNAAATAAEDQDTDMEAEIAVDDNDEEQPPLAFLNDDSDDQGVESAAAAAVEAANETEAEAESEQAADGEGDAAIDEEVEEESKEAEAEGEGEGEGEGEEEEEGATHSDTEVNEAESPAEDEEDKEREAEEEQEEEQEEAEKKKQVKDDDDDQEMEPEEEVENRSNKSTPKRKGSKKVTNKSDSVKARGRGRGRGRGGRGRGRGRGGRGGRQSTAAAVVQDADDGDVSDSHSEVEHDYANHHVRLGLYTPAADSTARYVNDSTLFQFHCVEPDSQERVPVRVHNCDLTTTRDLSRVYIGLVMCDEPSRPGSTLLKGIRAGILRLNNLNDVQADVFATDAERMAKLCENEHLISDQAHDATDVNTWKFPQRTHRTLTATVAMIGDARQHRRRSDDKDGKLVEKPEEKERQRVPYRMLMVDISKPTKKRANAITLGVQSPDPVRLLVRLPDTDKLPFRHCVYPQYTHDNRDMFRLFRTLYTDMSAHEPKRGSDRVSSNLLLQGYQIRSWCGLPVHASWGGVSAARVSDGSQELLVYFRPLFCMLSVDESKEAKNANVPTPQAAARLLTPSESGWCSVKWRKEPGAAAETVPLPSRSHTCRFTHVECFPMMILFVVRTNRTVSDAEATRLGLGRTSAPSAAPAAAKASPRKELKKKSLAEPVASGAQESAAQQVDTYLLFALMRPYGFPVHNNKPLINKAVLLVRLDATQTGAPLRCFPQPRSVVVVCEKTLVVVPLTLEKPSPLSRYAYNTALTRTEQEFLDLRRSLASSGLPADPKFLTDMYKIMVDIDVADVKDICQWYHGKSRETAGGGSPYTLLSVALFAACNIILDPTGTVFDVNKTTALDVWRRIGECLGQFLHSMLQNCFTSHLVDNSDNMLPDKRKRLLQLLHARSFVVPRKTIEAFNDFQTHSDLVVDYVYQLVRLVTDFALFQRAVIGDDESLLSKAFERRSYDPDKEPKDFYFPQTTDVASILDMNSVERLMSLYTSHTAHACGLPTAIMTQHGEMMSDADVHGIKGSDSALFLLHFAHKSVMDMDTASTEYKALRARHASLKSVPDGASKAAFQAAENKFSYPIHVYFGKPGDSSTKPLILRIDEQDLLRGFARLATKQLEMELASELKYEDDKQFFINSDTWQTKRSTKDPLALHHLNWLTMVPHVELHLFDNTLNTFPYEPTEAHDDDDDKAKDKDEDKGDGDGDGDDDDDKSRSGANAKGRLPRSWMMVCEQKHLEDLFARHWNNSDDVQAFVVFIDPSEKDREWGNWRLPFFDGPAALQDENKTVDRTPFMEQLKAYRSKWRRAFYELCGMVHSPYETDAAYIPHKTRSDKHKLLWPSTYGVKIVASSMLHTDVAEYAATGRMYRVSPPLEEEDRPLQLVPAPGADGKNEKDEKEEKQDDEEATLRTAASDAIRLRNMAEAHKNIMALQKLRLKREASRSPAKKSKSDEEQKQQHPQPKKRKGKNSKALVLADDAEEVAASGEESSGAVQLAASTDDTDELVHEELHYIGVESAESTNALPRGHNAPYYDERKDMNELPAWCRRACADLDTKRFTTLYLRRLAKYSSVNKSKVVVKLRSHIGQRVPRTFASSTQLQTLVKHDQESTLFHAIQQTVMADPMNRHPAHAGIRPDDVTKEAMQLFGQNDVNADGKWRLKLLCRFLLLGLVQGESWRLSVHARTTKSHKISYGHGWTKNKVDTRLGATAQDQKEMERFLERESERSRAMSDEKQDEKSKSNSLDADDAGGFNAHAAAETLKRMFRANEGNRGDDDEEDEDGKGDAKNKTTQREDDKGDAKDKTTQRKTGRHARTSDASNARHKRIGVLHEVLDDMLRWLGPPHRGSQSLEPKDVERGAGHGGQSSKPTKQHKNSKQQQYQPPEVVNVPSLLKPMFDSYPFECHIAVGISFILAELWNDLVVGIGIGTMGDDDDDHRVSVSTEQRTINQSLASTIEALLRNKVAQQRRKYGGVGAGGSGASLSLESDKDDKDGDTDMKAAGPASKEPYSGEWKEPFERAVKVLENHIERYITARIMPTVVANMKKFEKNIKLAGTKKSATPTAAAPLASQELGGQTLRDIEWLLQGLILKDETAEKKKQKRQRDGKDEKDEDGDDQDEETEEPTEPFSKEAVARAVQKLKAVYKKGNAKAFEKALRDLVSLKGRTETEKAFKFLVMRMGDGTLYFSDKGLKLAVEKLHETYDKAEADAIEIAFRTMRKDWDKKWKIPFINRKNWRPADVNAKKWLVQDELATRNTLDEKKLGLKPGSRSKTRGFVLLADTQLLARIYAVEMNKLHRQPHAEFKRRVTATRDFAARVLKLFMEHGEAENVPGAKYDKRFSEAKRSSASSDDAQKQQFLLERFVDWFVGSNNFESQGKHKGDKKTNRRKERRSAAHGALTSQYVGAYKFPTLVAFFGDHLPASMKPGGDASASGQGEADDRPHMTAHIVYENYLRVRADPVLRRQLREFARRHCYNDSMFRLARDLRLDIVGQVAGMQRLSHKVYFMARYLQEKPLVDTEPGRPPMLAADLMLEFYTEVQNFQSFIGEDVARAACTPEEISLLFQEPQESARELLVEPGKQNIRHTSVAHINKQLSQLFQASNPFTRMLPPTELRSALGVYNPQFDPRIDLPLHFDLPVKRRHIGHQGHGRGVKSVDPHQSVQRRFIPKAIWRKPELKELYGMSDILQRKLTDGEGDKTFHGRALEWRNAERTLYRRRENLDHESDSKVPIKFMETSSQNEKHAWDNMMASFQQPLFRETPSGRPRACMPDRGGLRIEYTPSLLETSSLDSERYVSTAAPALLFATDADAESLSVKHEPGTAAVTRVKREKATAASASTSTALVADRFAGLLDDADDDDDEKEQTQDSMDVSSDSKDQDANRSKALTSASSASSSTQLTPFVPLALDLQDNGFDFMDRPDIWAAGALLLLKAMTRTPEMPAGYAPSELEFLVSLRCHYEKRIIGRDKAFEGLFVQLNKGEKRVRQWHVCLHMNHMFGLHYYLVNQDLFTTSDLDEFVHMFNDILVELGGTRLYDAFQLALEDFEQSGHGDSRQHQIRHGTAATAAGSKTSKKSTSAMDLDEDDMDKDDTEPNDESEEKRWLEETSGRHFKQNTLAALSPHQEELKGGEKKGEKKVKVQFYDRIALHCMRGQMHNPPRVPMVRIRKNAITTSKGFNWSNVLGLIPLAFRGGMQTKRFQSFMLRHLQRINVERLVRYNEFQLTDIPAASDTVASAPPAAAAARSDSDPVASLGASSLDDMQDEPLVNVLGLESASAAAAAAAAADESVATATDSPQTDDDRRRFEARQEAESLTPKQMALVYDTTGEKQRLEEERAAQTLNQNKMYLLAYDQRMEAYRKGIVLHPLPGPAYSSLPFHNRHITWWIPSIFEWFTSNRPEEYEAAKWLYVNVYEPMHRRKDKITRTKSQSKRAADNDNGDEDMDPERANEDEEEEEEEEQQQEVRPPPDASERKGAASAKQQPKKSPTTPKVKKELGVSPRVKQETKSSPSAAGKRKRSEKSDGTAASTSAASGKKARTSNVIGDGGRTSAPRKAKDERKGKKKAKPTSDDEESASEEESGQESEAEDWYAHQESEEERSKRAALRAKLRAEKAAEKAAKRKKQLRKKVVKIRKRLGMQQKQSNTQAGSPRSTAETASADDQDESPETEAADEQTSTSASAETDQGAVAGADQMDTATDDMPELESFAVVATDDN